MGLRSVAITWDKLVTRSLYYIEVVPELKGMYPLRNCYFSQLHEWKLDRLTKFDSPYTYKLLTDDSQMLKREVPVPVPMSTTRWGFFPIGVRCNRPSVINIEM
jgi:hypothetical protein